MQLAKGQGAHQVVSSALVGGSKANPEAKPCEMSYCEEWNRMEKVYT